MSQPLAFLSSVQRLSLPQGRFSAISGVARGKRASSSFRTSFFVKYTLSKSSQKGNPYFSRDPLYMRAEVRKSLEKLIFVEMEIVATCLLRVCEV